MRPSEQWIDSNDTKYAFVLPTDGQPQTWQEIKATEGELNAI